MPSPPFQRWLPSQGERYFLILGNGMLEGFPWSDTAFDHGAWHFGNCFKTYEHAEQAREKRQEGLHTLHQEHASLRIASP
jgi:hypothetical protein